MAQPDQTMVNLLILIPQMRTVFIELQIGSVNNAHRAKLSESRVRGTVRCGATTETRTASKERKKLALGS